MSVDVTTGIVKTDCALCVHSCGLDVHLEQGRITAVTGMKEHPLSQGYLCPRGEALLEYVHSPDRLRYPLIRNGDGWQRITWDQALDEIAGRLDALRRSDGARALALYCGSVGVENIELSAFAQRFRGAFGTPNFLSVESFCYHSLITARLLTFGRFLMEQPEQAGYIILWAHNPDDSFPTRVRRINEALDAGGSIAVVDVRRTPLAQRGVFLRPRPETDCALALAMINVIIGEDLYDAEFVQNWTIGFDLLRQHVRQYDPEWAQRVTGVPAGDIREVARGFARAPSACIVQGTCSFDQQENGMQTMRALAILQAITGNVNRPGSWVRVPFPRLADLRLPVDEDPIGVADYPLFHDIWGRKYPYGHALALPDAVLNGDPYPIRALIVTGGNPAVTFPGSGLIRRTLEQLDLLVVMDVFMTETARLADIVLPAATFMEKAGIAFTYAVDQGVPYMMLRKPVLEVPECRAEWQVWTELAHRLGHGDRFPWKSIDEVISHMLGPSGVSLDDLRQNPAGLYFGRIEYGVRERLFATPSGKIELYSETLARQGHDPLPVHHPSKVTVADEQFPLILLVGNRDIAYTHSQLRNIPSVRKIMPEPLAGMHPDTGSRYGVADGAQVTIVTRAGRISMRTCYDLTMAPGQVRIPKGWDQAKCNELTDDRVRDPVMGYPAIKNIRCRIESGEGCV